MRASVFALSCMFAVGACGASPPDRARTTGDLEDIAWLLGTWESRDEEPAGERWVRSARGFVGSGYVIPPGECDDDADDAAEAEAPCRAEPVETESLELLERDGGLIYVATPRSQERTEFVVTELDAAHLVAENPEHDFPSRIEYRRTAIGLRVIVSSSERSFTLDLFPQ